MMHLAQLVDEFALAMRSENYAPRSVETTLGVRRRARASWTNGGPATLDDFTLSNGRTDLAFLPGEHVRFDGHPCAPAGGRMSPATVHPHIRNLRAFAGWLDIEGYTDRNVRARLRLPRLPQPLIEPYYGIRVTSDAPRIQSDHGDRGSWRRDLAGPARHGDSVDGALPNHHVRAEPRDRPRADPRKRLQRPHRGDGPAGATIRAALRLSPPTGADSGERGPALPNALGAAAEPHYAAQGVRSPRRLLGVDRAHAHLCRHPLAVSYLKNARDVLTLPRMRRHSCLQMGNDYLHLATRDVVERHRRFTRLDHLRL